MRVDQQQPQSQPQSQSELVQRMFIVTSFLSHLEHLPTAYGLPMRGMSRG